MQGGSTLSTPAVGSLKEPTIHAIYESITGTWQYIVADVTTRKAIIIDSVLDYDPTTQNIRTHTADSLLDIVTENNYTIEKILETHAHADHLTAASYLQKRFEESQDLRPSIGIGKRITLVQEFFGRRYGIPDEECEGVFDELFHDDDSFQVGNLTVTVVHLPGHTPDHVGYIVGDNVFCGDSLFHVDMGTARCDFPGGDATSLYNSVQRLLNLPDHFRVWTGHDYLSKERNTPIPCLTVKDHKERNKLVANGVTEKEFVLMRKKRDSELAEPRLLNPSLQINIRAGRLPHPTALGQRLLHVPLKLNGVNW